MNVQSLELTLHPNWIGCNTPSNLINLAVDDPKNKISDVKLSFDDLERSDWLENIEWPIRMHRVNVC